VASGPLSLNVNTFTSGMRSPTAIVIIEHSSGGGSGCGGRSQVL
jgi:hypothetical protein